ncbi:retrovirus-related pol polyprotein from transposon TNT 1-94, partial [Tanacetum coccineum]
TKLYLVTPFPKSKVIPKVVEKNALSKSVNSHLTTNKIIEKCTKVLAPGLLKIETEPINAYFKNNKVVHRDYLKVTKEHVATLHKLLEEARALKPISLLSEFKNRSNSTTIILQLLWDMEIFKWGIFLFYLSTTLKDLNLEGVDLLSGSRGSNLYTISMADMMKSSPICLLSKASKTKSWLWHRRLSHLNFGTINKLAKQGLVKGLPKLKYTKDHLCSACQMGKSKKESHPHKPKPSTNEKLQMLHMNLCGPMRVESINKKSYILVIVDDYSRFTWVKFLRTKDEALEIIIKVLKQAQVSLNATIRYLRTDNGIEFLNQTLRYYTEDVGITHNTSTARTP